MANTEAKGSSPRRGEGEHEDAHEDEQRKGGERGQVAGVSQLAKNISSELACLDRFPTGRRKLRFKALHPEAQRDARKCSVSDEPAKSFSNVSGRPERSDISRLLGG